MGSDNKMITHTTTMSKSLRGGSADEYSTANSTIMITPTRRQCRTLAVLVCCVLGAQAAAEWKRDPSVGPNAYKHVSENGNITQFTGSFDEAKNPSMGVMRHFMEESTNTFYGDFNGGDPWCGVYIQNKRNVLKTFVFDHGKMAGLFNGDDRNTTILLNTAFERLADYLDSLPEDNPNRLAVHYDGRIIWIFEGEFEKTADGESIPSVGIITYIATGETCKFVVYKGKTIRPEDGKTTLLLREKGKDHGSPDHFDATLTLPDGKIVRYEGGYRPDGSSYEVSNESRRRLGELPACPTISRILREEKRAANRA